MNIISSTFWKQKWNILLTLIIDIAFLAVVFVWNKYLSALIDFVLGGNKITSSMILRFILILAIFILANALTSFMSSFTCEQINFFLRENYIRNVAENDFDYFRHVSGGNETSVLLNELSSVCSFISSNLFFIIDSAIKFTGTFGWFLILNPKLAILSNLPVAGILIYVSFTSKILKKYTIRANEEKSKLSSITESLMSLFPIIKLYDAGKMIFENYEKSVSTWENTITIMEKRKSVLMSISALITCIPLMLTILIGGRQIIQGRMTIGQLYIFINLSGNVSGILMNMPSFIMQFRVFAGNIQKITGAKKSGGKND